MLHFILQNFNKEKNGARDIMIFFLIRLIFQLKISLMANILFSLNSKSNYGWPKAIKSVQHADKAFPASFHISIFQRYKNTAACMLVCLLLFQPK